MATVAAQTGGIFTTRAKTNGTAGTHYITGFTDFSKAIICIDNNGTVTTVTTTLEGGTGYSASGLGDSTAFTLGTVGATNGRVIIAGSSFESARYLDSSSRVAITVSTGGDINISAVQLPNN